MTVEIAIDCVVLIGCWLEVREKSEEGETGET